MAISFGRLLGAIGGFTSRLSQPPQLGARMIFGGLADFQRLATENPPFAIPEHMLPSDYPLSSTSFVAASGGVQFFGQRPAHTITLFRNTSAAPYSSQQTGGHYWTVNDNAPGLIVAWQPNAAWQPFATYNEPAYQARWPIFSLRPFFIPNTGLLIFYGFVSPKKNTARTLTTGAIQRLQYEQQVGLWPLRIPPRWNPYANSWTANAYSYFGVFPAGTYTVSTWVEDPNGTRIGNISQIQITLQTDGWVRISANGAQATDAGTPQRARLGNPNFYGQNTLVIDITPRPAAIAPVCATNGLMAQEYSQAASLANPFYRFLDARINIQRPTVIGLKTSLSFSPIDPVQDFYLSARFSVNDTFVTHYYYPQQKRHTIAALYGGSLSYTDAAPPATHSVSAWVYAQRLAQQVLFTNISIDGAAQPTVTRPVTLPQLLPPVSSPRIVIAGQGILKSILMQELVV